MPTVLRQRRLNILTWPTSRFWKPGRPKAAQFCARMDGSVAGSVEESSHEKSSNVFAPVVAISRVSSDTHFQ
jgi:hypothetical protein